MAYPRFGVAEAGLVAPWAKPNLAARTPMGITILNEGFRSSKRKRGGAFVAYVSWKTQEKDYWPTPRLSGSGACHVMTRRGSGDLATVLRAERSYAEKYPPDPDHPTVPPVTRGNIANPEFVEWIQGLPRGWTSLDADVAPITTPRVSEDKRLRTLDLFTGCGGLTLGLHPWCRVVSYCESHKGYRAIVEARIASKHLDSAPVFRDVKSLTRGVLVANGVDPAVDMISAGFPCTNISNAGRMEGLEGRESGLFYEVARLVHELRPQHVFLENVAAITSEKMAAVLRTIVDTLRGDGYGIRWGVFTACEAGAPHRRRRWFLLATRGGLKDTVPSLGVEEQCSMAETWDPEPGLEKRLLHGSAKDTTIRNDTLGNAVCVRQAELAFRCLAHGGLDPRR